MLLQYSENKRDMQIKISFFGHPKYNKYICTIFNSKFMGKNEKTSPKVASIASELLRDPKTPKKVKTVAASALTQTADKKKSKK